MIIFTDGRTVWTSDQLVTRPLPKHSTIQSQNKHIPTSNIHALCGIRTHDPIFQASEDSTCPRPFGYRDRHCPISRTEIIHVYMYTPLCYFLFERLGIAVRLRDAHSESWLRYRPCWLRFIMVFLSFQAHTGTMPQMSFSSRSFRIYRSSVTLLYYIVQLLTENNINPPHTPKKASQGEVIKKCYEKMY
jgi:hypothetical protein